MIGAEFRDLGRHILVVLGIPETVDALSRILAHIKINTILKGLIWEAIGVVFLFSYLWATTGDLATAGAVGLGYPAFRAIIWYPYERMYKRIRRSRADGQGYAMAFSQGCRAGCHTQNKLVANLKTEFCPCLCDENLVVSKASLIIAKTDHRMRRIIHEEIDEMIGGTPSMFCPCLCTDNMVTSQKLIKKAKTDHVLRRTLHDTLDGRIDGVLDIDGT